MEELYLSMKKKKVFETSNELNEKCLKIANLWKKHWNEMINCYINGDIFVDDPEFANIISKTQMFANLI